MNYNNIVIGERIKTARCNPFNGVPGYSQSNLAVALGLDSTSRTTIRKWEKGEILPPLDHLLKMCELFGCELGFLLGEYDLPTRVATDIQKETGLSLSAIEVLQLLKKQSKSSEVYRNLIETINLLLEHIDERKSALEVVPLLECISSYLHCAPDDERVVAVEENGEVHIYQDRDSFQKEQSPVISFGDLRKIVKVSLEQRVMNELRNMWEEKNVESRKKYIERILQDIQKTHK